MNKYIFINLICIIAMTGCTIKVGSRFDDSMVRHIKPEQTTQAEVMTLLGSPKSEGMKNGLPLWIYLFAEVPLFGDSAEGMLLTIEFNEDRIVESYSYVPY